MTPLEELQAAHKRLSELRGASTDGVWTVRNMDDPDGLNDGDTDDPMSPAGQGWWWVWAAQPSGYYGGVMETEGRMKSVGQTVIDDHDQGHQEHADADLVVTLHRTIDAQLTLLSEAMEDYEGVFIGDCPYPPHAVALARAINGGAS